MFSQTLGTALGDWMADSTGLGYEGGALVIAGLLAIIVYVILRGSGQGLYGFFAGLFVPVAAMVCEGAYEAWSSLRHDI